MFPNRRGGSHPRNLGLRPRVAHTLGRTTRGFRDHGVGLGPADASGAPAGGSRAAARHREARGVPRAQRRRLRGGGPRETGWKSAVRLPVPRGARGGVLQTVPRELGNGRRPTLEPSGRARRRAPTPAPPGPSTRTPSSSSSSSSSSSRATSRRPPDPSGSLTETPGIGSHLPRGSPPRARPRGERRRGGRVRSRRRVARFGGGGCCGSRGGVARRRLPRRTPSPLRRGSERRRTVTETQARDGTRERGRGDTRTTPRGYRAREGGRLRRRSGRGSHRQNVERRGGRRRRRRRGRGPPKRRPGSKRRGRTDGSRGESRGGRGVGGRRVPPVSQTAIRGVSRGVARVEVGKGVDAALVARAVVCHSRAVLLSVVDSAL